MNFAAWSEDARQAFMLAGELAARRRREREDLGSEENVHGVKITVADMREALRPVASTNWSGHTAPALDRRMNSLDDTEGPITLDQLREALK